MVSGCNEWRVFLDAGKMRVKEVVWSEERFSTGRNGFQG